VIMSHAFILELCVVCLDLTPR